MPHPRKYPVTEAEMEYPAAELDDMNETRYTGHHTICQTLRDIYQITKDLELSDEEKFEMIRLKSRLAMAMGKSMLTALHEYKNKYDPDSGSNVITR